LGLFNKDLKKEKAPPINQKEATPLQVVGLTFKLLYQRMNIWIYVNFWFVVFSLGVVTSPGARAALYHTIIATFRDPGGSRVKHLPAMKASFKKFFWKSLLSSLIKWGSLLLILFSLYFWLRQESLLLNLISGVSIYALLEWCLVTPYIFPIMVEHPASSVFSAYKNAFILTSRHPLQAIFFLLINLLILIIGVVLLGPILLILPAMRAMFTTHCYWYLSGTEIPGFVDINDYVKKHY
jgi:uncharacterized membrane protein YesL